jgi:RimJ/RimL family protein N-acetyltransferase
MYRSKDIYLTSVLQKDAEIMFEWINNKELVHLNNPYRPISFKSHIRWYENVIQDRNIVLFAIKLKSNNKLIGTCQLFDIDLLSQIAELQIRIGDISEQSKGYGSQAIELLTEFGWRDLNLRKIYLHVFFDNKRAISVYKKLGFIKEGTLINHSFVNGEYKDLYIMSKFRR